MAREYGEDFKRPVDPFTGESIPGAPRMAMPSTDRPGGSGYVVLMAEEIDTADRTPDRQAGGLR
jgi:hypothetical protein